MRSLFDLPPCPNCGLEYGLHISHEVNDDYTIHHYLVCDNCGFVSRDDRIQDLIKADADSPYPTFAVNRK